ncbi:hypothetical protein ACVJGD_008620 [Bradyrhizobium sp. USDA 10063]
MFFILARGLTPSCGFGLRFAAEPALTQSLRHIDVPVAGLPGQVVNALAHAVRAALDQTLG